MTGNDTAPANDYDRALGDSIVWGMPFRTWDRILFVLVLGTACLSAHQSVRKNRYRWKRNCELFSIIAGVALLSMSVWAGRLVVSNLFTILMIHSKIGISVIYEEWVKFTASPHHRRPKDKAVLDVRGSVGAHPSGAHLVGRVLTNRLGVDGRCLEALLVLRVTLHPRALSPCVADFPDSRPEVADEDMYSGWRRDCPLLLQPNAPMRAEAPMRALLEASALGKVFLFAEDQDWLMWFYEPWREKRVRDAVFDCLPEGNNRHPWKEIILSYLVFLHVGDAAQTEAILPMAASDRRGPEEVPPDSCYRSRRGYAWLGT